MVQNSSVRFDNMQVKTRPSAREVAAVYTVEEMSMELVVKLAPNHPLGVVSVDSGRKIGVAAAQWRSWMLQMTTFLTHQVWMVKAITKLLNNFLFLFFVFVLTESHSRLQASKDMRSGKEIRDWLSSCLLSYSRVCFNLNSNSGLSFYRQLSLTLVSLPLLWFWGIVKLFVGS